jgi:hypothetical protein
LAARKVERRLWEVKTGLPDTIPRAWADQAIGQVAAARPSYRLHVVGCLLTHLTTIENDAAQVARDALALVHHDAVTTLADLVGERLLDYAARCGSGSAAESGSARNAVEHCLPHGPWLADLFGPSSGRIIRRDDILQRYPA